MKKSQSYSDQRGDTYKNSKMNDTTNQFKRKIAYKLRIGQILEGKQVIEGERLQHIEVNNKKAARINIIANIVDKYIQDGEKKFGSITLDDATGQIKVKVFGDEVALFSDLNQGDTIMTIGLLRIWNNEIYLIPEIIKKKAPSYLLLRKLEVESNSPKIQNPEKIKELKEKIIEMVKKADDSGGIEIEKLILDLKEHPDTINSEIKKLLEDGLAYEPRPGRLRYLG